MGGAVVLHPCRQRNLLLHGAEQVQYPLLAEQSFTPIDQITDLVARDARNHDPLRRGRPDWLTLDFEPFRGDTEWNRPDLDQIAELTLQFRHHPFGIRH